MTDLPLWHRLAARCALALRRHRGGFPEDLSGACLVGAVALGIALRRRRVPFKFATAWLDKWHTGHGWIVVDGVSVDITATQFGFSDFVKLQPVVKRFRTKAPGYVFRAFRAQEPRRIWHHSEPRRNYKVLVPVLADVLGVTRAEARNIARAFIGSEVRCG